MLGWGQFFVLLGRASLITKREKAVNIARIMQVYTGSRSSIHKVVQTVVFSILLGLIWINEASDDSGTTVRSTAGVLFFVWLACSFFTIQFVLDFD